MAERKFNPDSLYNNPAGNPTHNPNIITMDQMLTWHAYANSIENPSPLMEEFKRHIEARLAEIARGFHSGPNLIEKAN